MGPDEVHARQVLLDMQELLSRDPYEALGLIPSATASDIRSAFLSKTKQFHPARFGRMSPEIQRLANEVFLALRATHESLARPNVVRSSAGQRPSGAIPTLAQRPGGTGASPVLRPSPLGTSPRPIGAHAASGTSGPNATVGHGNGHNGQAGQANGHHSNGAGHGPGHGHTPGSAPNPTIARPSNWPSSTPATRPGTAPTPIRPPTQPMRTVEPHPPGRPSGSGAMPPVTGARPHGTSGAVPPSGARPGVSGGVSGTGPRPAPVSGGTGGVSGSGPRPAPGAANAAPVERELVPIYELFAQGQVGAARVALETLVARAPQSTRYRSLLAFARGREAQLSGRVDEARVELQDALTLDPDLQLAKTALAELFTRRR